MRMMLGLLLLVTMVGANRPALAGTISVSGYEYLSGPIEEVSFVQAVGGLEISSGGSLSLGNRSSRTAAIPLLGGDMRITIDKPTIAAAGVFERVIVTSIPEPGHYAMLQTGLGLMSILAYGQRGGIDATSLVVDANSPYTASTRRPLKGPDVFFSASEHDIGHLPKQETVNAVPEPSSIVLATIGLLALFTRRSRKGAPRPRLPHGYFHFAHTA